MATSDGLVATNEEFTPAEEPAMEWLVATRPLDEDAAAEQLALLTNDPQFHAWQSAKAARENRARVATNLLAVAGCVLLAVTMAGAARRLSRA